MRRAFLAVALLALAGLLVRAARTGLAGDYVDPISHITTQDEALYANSAISMVRGGDWLTPKFMGRLALYKPPLLTWVSALSARVLGISRLGLRLPVALWCSLAVGLVFLFAAELRGWEFGACAALLLASSHLWHVLASSAMTDGLLVAFYVAAMYCIFADPWLESRAAFWGFAGAVAGAVLTKSIAGLLPLGVLGLYWLAAPAKYKPSLGRVCLVGVAAAALAAPWFLYQLAAHGRWFRAEHIGVEILGYGAGAPPQTSRESHALFYLVRMVLMDPVLTAVAAIALPGFVMALKRRSAEATLLGCWLLVVLASVAVWQYRNVSYLLPLLPALAIVGAGFGPFASMRPAWWALALVAAAGLMKAGAPTSPAGLSFAAGTVQPLAPVLSSYCERRRGNELIVAGMDDDLYASTLPLARLRYAVMQTPAENAAYAMDFASMGIIVTAGQFDDLAHWTPVFRDRLRQWGVDSDTPIGTLIVARSVEELGAVIRSHPDSDFLLPNRYRAAADATGHVLLDATPDHFLLLARNSKGAGAAPWSCGL